MKIDNISIISYHIIHYYYDNNFRKKSKFDNLRLILFFLSDMNFQSNLIKITKIDNISIIPYHIILFIFIMITILEK